MASASQDRRLAATFCPRRIVAMSPTRPHPSSTATNGSIKSERAEHEESSTQGSVQCTCGEPFFEKNQRPAVVTAIRTVRLAAPYHLSAILKSWATLHLARVSPSTVPFDVHDNSAISWLQHCMRTFERPSSIKKLRAMMLPKV